MLRNALFSPRPFLLSVAFLALPMLLAAQNRLDPGPYYGFWQMQEPAGDQFVVNIKRAGRASSFYIGSASSEVLKGTWEFDGEAIVVTWESGHRDRFKRWSDGTLEREAYTPDDSIQGEPNYVTRAIRVDPRTPGSLTVGGRTPGSEEATEDSSAPADATPETAPQAPMRNPFIGYWMVEQSPGMFFGLIGEATDRFYLHLDRNGQASVALRRWDGDNTARGRWEMVDGEARITWPSNRKDALVKDSQGSFRLHSYRRRDDFSDRPNERREARRSTPREAAQYFNSGDVRLLTMTDIRGVWAPADPTLDDQRRVHILGWGNAQQRSADTGEVLTNGTWKLFNDHAVITWEDGSQDLLRSNLVHWVLERFPIGEPVTGNPLRSFRVLRVEGVEPASGAATR